MKYAFRERKKGIEICRCFGEGGSVVIPGEIDGKPVYRLADHIFAGNGPDLEDCFWAEEQLTFTGEQPLARKTDDGKCMDPGPEISIGVKEISFPPSVREIGSYAFYGCEQLKRIVLPGSLRRLESGIFTACNHIERVCFYSEGEERETPSVLREILLELDYEVTVCLMNGGKERREYARLLFPGFYEDSIENTPARIIEIRYEGTGYAYRQCFQRGKIDYQQYDSQFYLASVQETPRTAAEVAMGRLAFPCSLSSPHKEQYLRFLTEHDDVCAELVLDSEEDVEFIMLLCRENYFSEERFDAWLEQCIRKGDARLSGILMEERRKRFPVENKKKTYLF